MPWKGGICQLGSAIRNDIQAIYPELGVYPELGMNTTSNPFIILLALL